MYLISWSLHVLVHVYICIIADTSNDNSKYSRTLDAQPLENWTTAASSIQSD